MIAFGTLEIVPLRLRVGSAQDDAGSGNVHKCEFIDRTEHG